LSHDESPGVVDLLLARAEQATMDWRDCVLSVEFVGGSLDLITAGRKKGNYRARLQHLDWETLYRDFDIGGYIDSVRAEWKEDYDFVLIDSRTGVTDIGDICTVLLPDVLVLLFVTNWQNVRGIKSVVGRAIQARSRLPIQRSRLLAGPRT
jgi:hypothetical protein